MRPCRDDGAGGDDGGRARNSTSRARDEYGHELFRVGA